MRFNHVGVIGEIDSLPGCSQVAVFHSVFNPGEKAKGVGRLAHDARLQEAHHLGYDVAMCTVNMENIPQLRILEKAGWTNVTSFKSSKTGHTVGVFFRDV
jgi:RimJ/RimL family protein N-acetyltransferase